MKNVVDRSKTEEKKQFYAIIPVQMESYGLSIQQRVENITYGKYTYIKSSFGGKTSKITEKNKGGWEVLR